MKALILSLFIVINAYGEHKEICVEGINSYILYSGKEMYIDVCLMIPDDSIEVSTKEKILNFFAIKDIEVISTVKGREKALDELMNILGTKNMHYSKFSIYHDFKK